MTFKIWMGMGAAGFAGAWVRAGVGLLCARWSAFPYGTLAVNLIGGFFVGFLAALMVRGVLSHDLRFILVTGFLGAFTTFSAFSLETIQLMKSGLPGAAMIHVFLNVVGSLTLTAAGLYVGRSFAAP